MPPFQFMTPMRCGEVPHLRQQPGPIRTLLERCTHPRRQWCDRVEKNEKGGRWKGKGWKGLWVGQRWHWLWLWLHCCFWTGTRSALFLTSLKQHLHCQKAQKTWSETHYTTTNTANTTFTASTTTTTSSKRTVNDILYISIYQMKEILWNLTPILSLLLFCFSIFFHVSHVTTVTVCWILSAAKTWVTYTKYCASPHPVLAQKENWICCCCCCANVLLLLLGSYGYCVLQ